MENKYGIVGVAHVGLPTNDLQKTVEFYKSLGFKEIMQTYNEKALKVCIRKSAMKNTRLLQTESKNCHFGKMV